ncbi:unnamed protein product [Didymodactylos carnosus]|uniref:Uncharacterized protein n=1 Tax=Didymodactylos carnosus TaxID=1234261 RepID=A0A814KHB3_9BILA|nr:unnamed protein product [Didymodactylos carnosus]CAF3819121.1 unnamed protein product [Didymodactylos carnosus]
MSRHYMKLLKEPDRVAKTVQQHGQLRLIFLQHNNPAVKEHACKLIEILVQAEFLKATAGGTTPLDPEHEYEINKIERRLKLPLTDHQVKTIHDLAIQITQASIKLHASLTGIGYNVDQTLGTDKQVFSIMGPHRDHYYGDIFVIFKLEIMLHPDANFSVQAATTFGPSLSAYTHRSWLKNPNNDGKCTEQFHSSKLHCSVPHYEYAAARELVALTGKDKQTMDAR